jgi:hypothetical protein
MPSIPSKVELLAEFKSAIVNQNIAKLEFYVKHHGMQWDNDLVMLCVQNMCYAVMIHFKLKQGRGQVDDAEIDNDYESDSEDEIANAIAVGIELANYALDEDDVDYIIA